MTRQAEAALHRRIQLAVKAKYPKAYCRKISDRFVRGVPDLLIVVPLRDHYRQDGEANCCPVPGTLFVEVKTPEGRLPAIQKVEHEKIRAAGGDVLVTRDVKRVLFWLEQMGAVEG